MSFSTCIKAESVQTAVIVFNDWTSQEISLYSEGEFVEVEWTVGPIPIDIGIPTFCFTFWRMNFAYSV